MHICIYIRIYIRLSITYELECTSGSFPTVYGVYHMVWMLSWTVPRTKKLFGDWIMRFSLCLHWHSGDTNEDGCKGEWYCGKSNDQPQNEMAYTTHLRLDCFAFSSLASGFKRSISMSVGHWSAVPQRMAHGATGCDKTWKMTDDWQENHLYMDYMNGYTWNKYTLYDDMIMQLWRGIHG